MKPGLALQPLTENTKTLNRQTTAIRGRRRLALCGSVANVSYAVLAVLIDDRLLGRQVLHLLTAGPIKDCARASSNCSGLRVGIEPNGAIANR